MKDNLVVFHGLNTDTTKNFLRNVEPYIGKYTLYGNNQQRDSDYFVSSRDPRMFEGVLDYCKEHQVEKLYITYLVNPEYLLTRLDRKLKTKIIFATHLREVALSKGRAKVFRELIEHKNISKVLIHSNTGPEAILEKNCSPILLESKIYKNRKLVSLYDPICFDHKILSREESIQSLSSSLNQKIRIGKKDIVFFFFGSMNYGKGFDELLDAIRKMNNINYKNIKFLIMSNLRTANFSLNIDEIRKISKVILINKYVTDEEMLNGFNISDYVILPYKESYRYGSSGNLVTACLYQKPVIVPDFYPFSDLVEKYKFGLTFNRNNDGLMASINTMINTGKSIDKENFLDYTSKIQTWEQYVKLGGLGG